MDLTDLKDYSIKEKAQGESGRSRMEVTEHLFRSALKTAHKHQAIIHLSAFADID